MVAIVLLPGLDGTGQLTHEIVEALGAEVQAQVVSYPPQVVLGYEELAILVNEALPRDRPFVILAESFSGPIGCLVAASRPPGLVGLVLCASFAVSPFPALRRLSPLLRFAPVPGLPVSLLALLLLGRWSSPVHVQRLRGALASVSPAVLRARARTALSAVQVEHLAAIQVPVLYLRAEFDRLIHRSAASRLQGFIPSARVVVVPGPHFLLQAAPSACAALVSSFAKSVAPRF
jgi:pimeloyl-ACP methyl ester carboxylesterase